MDNPDLIEQYERDFWDKIYQMKDNSISFETTLFLLKDIISKLDIVSYTEKYLKEYIK